MLRGELAHRWRSSGIDPGDTLLVHSSLKRTLTNFSEQGEDISPGLVTESFLDAVGDEGTLLLPLFNFDFTKGVPFDIRSTPSQMGAMTEAGRLMPGAVRTGHPIYSFAVIGANADLFEGVDNFSGYGSDSPFAMLRELDGKIAILDLTDLNSQTFYHHVEEIHDVPYRYHKEFTGLYTDTEGVETERTYGLFVRDIEKGVLTHVDPAGELMWEAGLYSGDRPKENSGLRVVSARMMYDFVADIIDSGRAEGVLYRIEEETERD